MRRLVSWGTFAIVLLVAWLFLAPTSLGGRVSYVIVDGTSMEPTYRNGDLVLTTARDRYQVGDVIAYDTPGDVHFPVIHRIVDRDDAGFVTQGDNRAEVDGWRATDGTIYGATWLHVPRGGTVLAFISQPPVVLGVLGGWLTLAYLRREERRRQAAAGDGGSDEQADRDAEPDADATEPDAAPEADAALHHPPRHRSGRRPVGRGATAVATLAAVVLAAAALVVAARAATLHVDGGVLQTYLIEFDDPCQGLAVHDPALCQEPDG